MASRTPVQHLEMEPRASDFLNLLRDLGHLDPAGFDRLTAELLQADRAGRRITLDDVRRAAAVLLFELAPSLRPDQRELLDAEWARLFS